MNYSRKCTVLIISALSLFAARFFSVAQEYETWVMDNWSQDKEEVFKEAKEQDKFVLLFVGRPTCPKCKETSELFSNPENAIKTFIEDNFVTLYKCYDVEEDRADVYEYIQEYHEEREAGLTRQIPWLYIINPEREGEIVTSMYRPFPDWSPDEETMLKFLSIDLLDGHDLDWYADEYKAYELARAQEKLIFKFVGNGTSPNSQMMMKLLHEEPFRQILEENFILWYVSDDDDCGCGDEILSDAIELKDGEENNPLPHISIINPASPYYDVLEELWGVQDEETMEEILIKYSVSNDKILNNNRVFVSDNMLIISNQTGNEQLRIYSLTGQSLATVHKNESTVCIDASHFPKGVLIVHSSAGWSAKIVKY